MDHLFKTVVLMVVSEKCFDEFFLKFNFMHGECLKATVSKGLGLGIIVGSTLVKVPQLMKILRARSAEGIQFAGVLLELVALSSAAAYNFNKGYAFSAWGESLFLLLETAGIGFLVLKYGGQPTVAFGFLGALIAALYTLFSGLTPLNVLWSMQAANLPIVLAAKMVQAVANYKQGHTGQLSGTTVTLLFLGSMARIFTSIQETGDSIIVATYLVATLANFILVAQMVYYWDATNKALTGKAALSKGKAAKSKTH